MSPPPPSPPRPIVILGPTAGGKSELAVALAQRLGGEVIGADSMQVYRHMDAGTAKPTAAMRQRAVHHLIDVVEPTQPFTAGDWVERAQAVLEELGVRRERGTAPAAGLREPGEPEQGTRAVIVGGTHLYLRALLEGMVRGPAPDQAFRATLEGTPSTRLHAQLTGIDPDAAARIAPADRQRLIRALEVFHLTGTPLSHQQTHWADDPDKPYHHHPIMIGLAWDREAINRRINARVKAMFYPHKVAPELAPELAASVCLHGESLPDEARRLDQARLLGPQAREALGYKQVLTMDSVDQAFEKTKILTRRLAKQQRTWFKRFRFVHWLAADTLGAQALADAATAVIREAEQRGAPAD